MKMLIMVELLTFLEKTTIYIYIFIYYFLYYFGVKMSIINIVVDNQIVRYLK